MHRAIITDQITPGRCLPLKTIDFTGDHIQARNLSARSKQRAQSSRTKATGIGRNIEIVMKLSQIYSTPTEFFQSITSNMAKSQQLSPKKSQSNISPAKKALLKSALLKQNKKQSQANINFSPMKVNNYKFFPKRQVKLKNNNPYKFYMFSEKNHHQSARSSRQNYKSKQIRVANICTFVKDPAPLKRKIVSLELRSNRQPFIQPWNNGRDQVKDDSIIF